MPALGLRVHLEALSSAVERHPGRAIAVVGFVLASAYAGAFLSGASRGNVIRGDAIQYYAYLRSAVFDRDFDFQNEYEFFYDAPASGARPNVWLTERTPAGRPPNMMSVGPALLWSPIYIVAASLLSLASSLGLGPPPDGFSTGLQLTAGLSGVFYATAGAWLSFLTAQRLFGPPVALWATLVAWLAGPAVYYSVISPTYSHATSLFAVALFVFVWLRSEGRYDNRRAALVGLVAGLAILVRWQDAIVLLLPAWELAWARATGRTTTSRVATFVGSMAVGAIVAVTPQLIAWHAVYGTALLMPQGGGFMRWGDPAILQVLFSTRHGLFLWTPAMLLAVIGLWRLRHRNRMVAGGALLLLVAAVYVNAAVSDWWAGEAFGARRFISYTPLFALGLAALAPSVESAASRVAVRVAAVGLVIYNVLFLLQYQLFMRGHTDLVPYPETVKEILFDRLLLPGRLLAAWLRG